AARRARDPRAGRRLALVREHAVPDRGPAPGRRRGRARVGAALRAVPRRAAGLRGRARVRARRHRAALLRPRRIGVAVGRRRRARAARLGDRRGGGGAALKVCAVWLAAAALVALAAAPALAQPAADLERVQAAITASRERVATYEREQRGLLEAV